MKGKGKIIVIALFALTLTLPSVLTLFGLQDSKKLEGVTHELGRGKFTLHNLLSGSFQRRAQKTFKRSLTMWPAMVRTDNQLNFWLFRQLSSNYESKVVLGKENHLIEFAYLKAVETRHSATEQRLKKLAVRLAALQNEFTSRGIGFVVVISPNKPGLYPELVPAGYKVPGLTAQPGEYEKLLPHLHEHEINLFDAHAYFSALKESSSHRFFPSSGTHWSDHAACLATRQLVDRMEQQLDRSVRSLRCNPVQLLPQPSYPERDLLRIANLWDHSPFLQAGQRPEVTVLNGKTGYQPKVLYVGTSFMWAMLRYFDGNRIHRERNFFYYFQSNDTFPKRGKKPIDRDGEAWKRDLLSHDVVVLEGNHAFPRKIGYGFTKRALLALQQLPPGRR